MSGLQLTPHLQPQRGVLVCFHTRTSNSNPHPLPRIARLPARYGQVYVNSLLNNFKANRMVKKINKPVPIVCKIIEPA
jgi:hypothetical protein